MTAADADTLSDDVRHALQRLPPPYLLRKYEATEEDYESLAEEDLRCEYLDGVLIVHSPATMDHEDRIIFLATLLNSFVAARNLGRVFGSNAVMQLGRRRFCPDLSFLSTRHAGRIQGGRLMGPFDLVVEMVSRSTREYDLSEKRQAYHDGQVPEIWMFDAERRSCIVDLLETGQYRTLTLSSGRFDSRVLPGLSIDVDWLWADPLPNPLECLRAATS